MQQFVADEAEGVTIADVIQREHVKRPIIDVLSAQQVKGKGSPILCASSGSRSSSQVLGSQRHSHKPGGRRPLLSTWPVITFPAAQHHRPFDQ